MNLLFLTPQLPYPARQGTAIRNFGLIEQLARHYSIDLLTFVTPGDYVAIDNPLNTLCRRIETIDQPARTTRARIRDTLLSAQPDMALRLASDTMSTRLREWVLEGDYAIVQAEGIEMARYGLEAQQIRDLPQPLKFVFDDHNCEYLLQKRNALTDIRTLKRFPAGVYSLLQWQKLRRYERALCRAADAVLAVSEPDAAALRALDPTLVVDVILNGIDAEAIPQSPFHEPPPPVLVFTGKMDYRPNIDAALWFADEVLPRILVVRPDARFQIVGQSPHARLDRLLSLPAVELTGAVDDVRPYIAGAGVYVMPLRVGGGTRFKALESMASAKPIVTTSLGVEGIGVANGREMLIADAPQAFADATLTLLDPAQRELRAYLGTNARTLVERAYGWQAIVAKLEAVYARL